MHILTQRAAEPAPSPKEERRGCYFQDLGPAQQPNTYHRIRQPIVKVLTEAASRQFSHTGRHRKPKTAEEQRKEKHFE